jgi:hypothetical protein
LAHGAWREGDAEFAAEAAQDGARAVQCLQRLLSDAFDTYWADLSTARCFKERRHVGRIGLVATHLGSDVLRWNELDLDAEGLIRELTAGERGDGSRLCWPSGLEA